MNGDADIERMFETLAEQDAVVDGLIAGRSYGEIAGMKYLPGFAETAAHFRRLAKLGRRCRPDAVHAEYLKAVCDDDPDGDELEKEVYYAGMIFPDLSDGQDEPSADDLAEISALAGSRFMP